MLTLRIQQLGDITIVHCIGRISFPEGCGLRIASLRQVRTRRMILDLADTVAIDAGGLGALVALRGWAKQTNRRLKLMNVTPRVEQLLQLTKLDSSFEVCSAEEMLDLLCRAIHNDESLKARLEVASAVDYGPEEGTALSVYANSSAA